MADCKYYDNKAMDIEEEIEEEKPEEIEKEKQEKEEKAKTAVQKYDDLIPPLTKENYRGDLEAVQERLRKRQDLIHVNTSIHKGIPPLHEACQSKQLDILRFLLSQGAEVNSHDSTGNTALHIAVYQNWHDGIEELLQHGASPDIMNKPRTSLRDLLIETPLHASVRIEDRVAFMMLLKYNPNVHIRDSKNDSIFHLAASSYSRLPILRHLLTLEDTENQLGYTRSDGYSLYHAALSNKSKAENDSNELKLLQTIYKFDDNVNQVNLLGESPLFLACRAGYLKVVYFLLANGADPARITRHGQSTLHAACMGGSTEILRHLIKLNLVNHLISKRDNHGHSPFYYASISSSPDCCQILLDNGEELSNSFRKVSNCYLVVKNLPSADHMLKETFDKCISLSKNKQSDPEFSITFDYAPLLSCNTGIESSVISEFVGTSLEPLLKHPLLESFLHVKWRQTRKWFYLYFIKYLIFLILNTIFIMHVFGKDGIKALENPHSLAALKGALICFLILIIVPGALIIFTNFRNYKKQFETYSSFCVVVFSLLTVFIPNENSSLNNSKNISSDHISEGNNVDIPHISNFSVHCSANVLFNTNDILSSIFSCDRLLEETESVRPTLSKERIIASLSLLFCWGHLMMLSGRIPSIGHYILMFTRVATLIVRFLAIFSSILIGFSLNFHILFPQMSQFSEFPLSFFKTITMMTGGIVFSEYVNQSKKDMPLNEYGLLVLGIFLFTTTVVMSNMIVGLTVNDLPELKRQGKIRRMVKIVSYVTSFEKILAYINGMKIFPKQCHNFIPQYKIKPLLTVYFNDELKKNSYRKKIPADTLKEAIVVGSCEETEDLPNIEDEDISTYLKTLHIKHASDRRTQRHKFSDLNSKFGAMQEQMDELQEKLESLNISGMQIQTGQFNDTMVNQLSQVQDTLQQLLKIQSKANEYE